MSEDIAPCILKLLRWIGVYVQLHAPAADCGVESQSSSSRWWEANDVCAQKVFCNLLSTACAVLLPCTHQASIRLCAQHYAVKAVLFCAIAVRVWSIKLFMATDIGRWWRECHHTSTVRWHSSWIGSCLCGRLAEVVHILISVICRSDPFHFFLWGCVKNEVYLPPVPIIMNT